MLRTTLARKLAVASRAMPARAAPFGMQRVCEFATTTTTTTPRRTAPKTVQKEEEDTSVATTTKRHDYDHSMARKSPWDAFFRTNSSSGGFDDWMLGHHLFEDPFFSSFVKHDPLLERMRQDVINMTMPVVRFRGPIGPTNNSRLVRASPGYEIKESDGNYEIVLDIPQGLERQDLKVELERDGTIVHISGEQRREEKSGDDQQSSTTVMTRFSKRFSIGDQVDTERMQANLSDGCLVIRAPKLPVEAKKRQIEITNKPHLEMSEEEIRHKNYNDAFDESDWAEEGKKAVA